MKARRGGDELLKVKHRPLARITEGQAASVGTSGRDLRRGISRKCGSNVTTVGSAFNAHAAITMSARWRSADSDPVLPP